MQQIVVKCQILKIRAEFAEFAGKPYFAGGISTIPIRYSGFFQIEIDNHERNSSEW